MEYQTTLICLLRNLYASQEATVRNEYGTIDCFKIGKGVRQGCILHPAYLTSMQSNTCKLQGWMNHKLESRLPRDSNNLRYTDDTTLMTESEKELKILLMSLKKRTMKKLAYNSTLKKKKKKKTEIMASGPITSWQIEGEKM